MPAATRLTSSCQRVHETFDLELSILNLGFGITTGVDYHAGLRKSQGEFISPTHGSAGKMKAEKNIKRMPPARP
jgi:hypothetical protein